MTTHLNDEMTAVQAQIGRADTKASILTGLSLAALTGGTAIVSAKHLHGAAVVTAVMAATWVFVALVQLGLAIRPALNGNYGFVRWAAMSSTSSIQIALDRREYPGTERDTQFEHLQLMARSAHLKHRRIRLAVDLLGAALTAAGLTAILSGLGW
jgi:hypothetical protein